MWRGRRSAGRLQQLAGGDPQVLLARGRVEREVGDGDSALAAFNGYLQHGTNRGLGQLEVARTLFLLGRFDGMAPYYEGAIERRFRHGSGVPERPRHHRLRQRPARVRPATAGPGERQYLKRFWGQRDRIELRSDGERLREHYRRLFYARKNFS